jgi:DNA end-binding protein Ku
MSLVTLPVSVYSAVNRAQAVPLHEIYRKTGERVHRLNVTEDGEEVEREDIIKGYEVEKGQYVLIEPEEIDELKIKSSKTLDIAQFVKIEDVDDVYFDSPYFVAPQRDSDEQTFAVIRDALRDSKKMGLGQLAIAGRERLCCIKPYGSGLMLITLRYETEVRDADPYFEDIREKPSSSEELELAEELIARKTAKFDPGKFHDHYREALKELIQAKIEHREPVAVEEDQPQPKVVNLMDALRKSLAEKEPAPRKSDARERPARESEAPKKTASHSHRRKAS